MIGLAARAWLEVRRVLPPRAWLLAVSGALALTAISVSGHVRSTTPVPTVAEAMGPAAPAFVAVALGVLLFANDLRHGSLPRWVLVVSHRHRLVAAKIVAAAATGATLAIGAAALSRGVAILAGAGDASPVEQASAAAWTAVSLALLGALSAAVAIAMHAVVAPMVVMLAIGPLLEAAVAASWDDGAHWLPHSLAAGLRSADPTPGAPPRLAQLGALVGWVFVVSRVAIRLFDRRDLGGQAS